MVKGLKPLSIWADSAGAIAAINGNFFHTVEGGSVCFASELMVPTPILPAPRPARWFLSELDDGALAVLLMAGPYCHASKGWGSQRQNRYRGRSPVDLKWQACELARLQQFQQKRYGRSLLDPV